LKIPRCALSALGLSLSCHAFADDVQLPDITVVGLRPVPVEFSYTDSPYVTPDNSVTQQWLTQHWNLVKAANGITDVRCVASGDLKNVTSLADTTSRYLAAASVYTKLQAASATLKSVTIGTAINPYDGVTYKAFKVTYADGGTEKWLVFPDPRASVKLFDTPLPDSLVPGNGVVQPSRWCTSTG